MSNKLNNKDFLLWKTEFTFYLYKIIKKTPEELKHKLNINIDKLYEENYHPYVAATLVIIKTDEYKKKEFYHDFVIPYQEKILIVNKTIIN